MKYMWLPNIKIRNSIWQIGITWKRKIWHWGITNIPRQKHRDFLTLNWQLGPIKILRIILKG